MARNEIRPLVKLKSTAATGYTYITRKNRRNDPDRGGKLAQFVADMLLNTALVSGTIVGYVWALDVRMKGIKQDPRMERPAARRHHAEI